MVKPNGRIPFPGDLFSVSMLYFEGVSWVASFSVTSIRIISLNGTILYLQLTGVGGQPTIYLSKNSSDEIGVISIL